MPDTLSTLADNSSHYGDVVVGFVVVQSITFLIALMKEDNLLREVVRLKPRIWKGVIGCNLFYFTILLMLASLESWLRVAPLENAKIQMAVWAFLVGRIIVVALSTAICLYVIKEAEFPRKKHSADTAGGS